jgi:hypothetical protein
MELYRADVSRRTEEPDRIEGIGLDETTEEVLARYTRPFFARMVLAALFGIVALALPRGRTRG